MYRAVIGILFLLLNSSSGPGIQDYDGNVAVIVHESVNIEQIDKNDLLEIYTLRKKYWSDKTLISIADYKGNSKIRSHFYSYLDIRVNTIKRIWLKEQFTGRSLPPKVVKSVEEMASLVVNNPGAIGYVPASEVPAEAKILVTIRK